ncbi:collagen alpha-1(I) chain-like [Chionomys nivalis]|uniref:collagen alpha-1(I) chain-like n=1 Tax=Chionomys nivalis TaxID=269649 RepID=UPI002596344C|nr:collagen alpha-1(I) chain-like [Chionomys nivalis]
MRADGGTAPFSTRRPRRGDGGTERGVRLGPASENQEETHQESGSGPTDTGPATDDAPANRARGGESPTGAREGAPQPRPRRASGTATRRVRNGSPREPPDADGSLGPPRPPDPGDGEATPPGVFKPTRRNAVARYPDRGRGRRREREDRRRDDAPGRAPSRDTGSVRHARPGATARGRAGRRRGALPFPPRRGGTRTRTTPQKQNTEEPDGKEGTHPRAAAVRERAAHDGTRTDEREKSEREEGGGWPEPREATRREPPSRRETDALPRDAPRLLTTPRFQAGGRGRALESGCGAAAGPPHTRGSEAQRRGERDDPGPAPGGVGRPGTGRAGDDTPRQRAWRERRAAGHPPDERRRRRGPGHREKPGRARARKRGGRGGRGREATTRGRSFPRGTGGGTPRPTTHGRAGPRGRGESSTGAPTVAAPEGKKKHASGGYLTARHPTRCGGGSPHETRLPGGRRRRRGRKSPQTHLGRRTHRHAADDGRPLSLLPSRGSRNARSPPLSHPLARTHRRDRRARRRRRTPRRRRAPTRPATRRETTDRRSPKAAPEREVTTPQSQNRIPGPEEGRVNRCSPTVGTLPGRGSEATPTRHTTRATHARDARSEAAVRGNGKDGEAREGPLAAGTDGGRVGPGSPPPPSPALFPARAPRPDRGAYAPSGERGDRGPAALGRAHTRPLRSPPRVTRPGLRHDTPASRHALLSRVVPPRTRSEEARAAVGDTNARVSPPKDGTRRGAPGRSYAHREVRACWGDQAGRRETPSTPAHRIAREGTFFSLRAGGTDPARRASGRGSARAGGATHTPLDDLERSEAGGPAVSARLLLPFRGAFLSVRGHRGPDREKT